jgi:hypothetical protein
MSLYLRGYIKKDRNRWNTLMEQDWAVGESKRPHSRKVDGIDDTIMFTEKFFQASRQDEILQESICQ